MAQIVGKIPDFTGDSTPAGERENKEVVKSTEVPAEEAVTKEKETLEPPAEKPADEILSEDTEEPSQVEVPDVNAIKSLQEERVKLLKEIAELRGQRREIKQEQLQKVEQQIDELKDINPDDVAVIERVLRGKGYVTKEEQQKMYYEAVKDEELNKFLSKYPEYKPENDPNDLNWNSLQREMAFYKMPLNPRDISLVLERAHRAVPKVHSDQTLQSRQRQIQVASAGAGGVQRSSSSKTANPRMSALMKSHMQGWSDEEIKNLEDKLSE